MMPPPELCGSPELVEEDPQQQESNTNTNSNSNNNNNTTTESDDDDDTVPPPQFPLRRFFFLPSSAPPGGASSSSSSSSCVSIGLELFISGYIQLPPSDALALLDGEDNTGLMIWQGSSRMAQYLLDSSTAPAPVAGGGAVSTRAAAVAAGMLRENDLQQNHRQNDGEEETKQTDENNATRGTAAGGADFLAPAERRGEIARLFAWAADASSSSSTSTTTSAVDTVIELGCGSGILGIVAAFVFRPRRLFLTDGNPECVELAQRNFERNRRRVGVTIENDTRFENQHQQQQQEEQQEQSAKPPIGFPLWWGDVCESDANALFGSSSSSASSSSCLVIVAGDVLYEAKSVAPFCKTVHSLALQFFKRRNQNRQEDENENNSNNNLSAHFFFTFYPRSWYDEVISSMMDGLRQLFTARGWETLVDVWGGVKYSADEHENEAEAQRNVKREKNTRILHLVLFSSSVAPRASSAEGDVNAVNDNADDDDADVQEEMISRIEARIVQRADARIAAAMAEA